MAKQKQSPRLAKMDYTERLMRHLEHIRKTVETLEAVPQAKRGPGWKDQYRYAKQVIANVEKGLAAMNNGQDGDGD